MLFFSSSFWREAHSRIYALDTYVRRLYSLLHRSFSPYEKKEQGKKSTTSQHSAKLRMVRACTVYTCLIT